MWQRAPGLDPKRGPSPDGSATDSAFSAGDWFLPTLGFGSCSCCRGSFPQPSSLLGCLGGPEHSLESVLSPQDPGCVTVTLRFCEPPKHGTSAEVQCGSHTLNFPLRFSKEQKWKLHDCLSKLVKGMNFYYLRGRIMSLLDDECLKS